MKRILSMLLAALMMLSLQNIVMANGEEPIFTIDGANAAKYIVNEESNAESGVYIWQQIPHGNANIARICINNWVTLKTPDISEAGLYKLVLNVGNGAVCNNAYAYELTVNGVKYTSDFRRTNTDGLNAFDIEFNAVELKAGENKIKIRINSGYNADRVVLIKSLKAYSQDSYSEPALEAWRTSNMGTELIYPEDILSDVKDTSSIKKELTNVSVSIDASGVCFNAKGDEKAVFKKIVNIPVKGKYNIIPYLGLDTATNGTIVKNVWEVKVDDIVICNNEELYALYDYENTHTGQGYDNKNFANGVLLEAGAHTFTFTMSANTVDKPVRMSYFIVKPVYAKADGSNIVFNTANIQYEVGDADYETRNGFWRSKNGCSVGVNVKALQSGTYKLEMNCKPLNNIDNAPYAYTVSINGKKHYSKNFKGTQNVEVLNDLGYVTLKNGLNNLEFSVDSLNNATDVNYIKLTKIDGINSAVYINPARALKSEPMNVQTRADYSGTNYYTRLRYTFADSYGGVKFDVDIPADGLYNIIVDGVGIDCKPQFDIIIGGKKVSSVLLGDYNSTLGSTKDDVAAAITSVNAVKAYLTQGTYEVVLAAKTGMPSVSGHYFDIFNIGFVNDTAVELIKNKDSNMAIKAIVQYQNDDNNFLDIQFVDMTDAYSETLDGAKVKKGFTPISVKGATKIKLFVWEFPSLTPLAEAVCY